MDVAERLDHLEKAVQALRAGEIATPSSDRGRNKREPGHLDRLLERMRGVDEALARALSSLARIHGQDPSGDTCSQATPSGMPLLYTLTDTMGSLEQRAGAIVESIEGLG